MIARAVTQWSRWMGPGGLGVLECGLPCQGGDSLQQSQNQTTDHSGAFSVFSHTARVGTGTEFFPQITSQLATSHSAGKNRFADRTRSLVRVWGISRIRPNLPSMLEHHQTPNAHLPCLQNTLTGRQRVIAVPRRPSLHQTTCSGRRKLLGRESLTPLLLALTPPFRRQPTRVPMTFPVPPVRDSRPGRVRQRSEMGGSLRIL